MDQNAQIQPDELEENPAISHNPDGTVTVKLRHSITGGPKGEVTEVTIKRPKLGLLRQLGGLEFNLRALDVGQVYGVAADKLAPMLCNLTPGMFDEIDIEDAVNIMEACAHFFDSIPMTGLIKR